MGLGNGVKRKFVPVQPSGTGRTLWDFSNDPKVVEERERIKASSRWLTNGSSQLLLLSIMLSSCVRCSSSLEGELLFIGAPLCSLTSAIASVRVSSTHSQNFFLRSAAPVVNVIALSTFLWSLVIEDACHCYFLTLAPY